MEAEMQIQTHSFQDPCFAESVPSGRELTSRTKALSIFWLKCVQTGCPVKINYLEGMG